MKLTRLLPLALLCELVALGTRTSAFSLIAALGARTAGADKRLAGWQTELRKE